MAFYSATINRDGTSQKQRQLAALDPMSIKIDERNMEDYLRQIYHLASQIAYYNSNDEVDGTWQDMLPREDEIPVLLQSLAIKKDVEPHIALILTFLKLLEVLKNDFNQIGNKHLLYYYKDILKFQEKKPVADKVHVIFELAKNINRSILLKNGTRLKAGKNELGEELFYALERDIAINKAQVKSIKTIFVEEAHNHRVYAAPIANSIDGLGLPLPPEAKGWPTFGESQFTKLLANRTMQNGEVGFAVSSPVLLLREGNRTVTLTLTLRSFLLTKANLDALQEEGEIPELIINQLLHLKDKIYDTQGGFENAIYALLGTENFDLYSNDILEETNRPLRQVVQDNLKNGFLIYYSAGNEWEAIKPTLIYKEGHNQISFLISLNNNKPPVVPFEVGNPIRQQFNSNFPIFKFVLNHSSNPYLYGVFKTLKLVEYRIKVDARGINNLILKNNEGSLNPKQPFFPFGVRPSIGSNLFIGSHEVFHKKLDTLNLEFLWIDLPTHSDGFQGQYQQYVAPYTSIDYRNHNRTASVSFLNQNTWVEADTEDERMIELFNPTNDGNLRSHPFTRSINIPISFNPSTHSVHPFSTFLQSEPNYMKLRLEDIDFGHHIFPIIYAGEALNIATEVGGTLPNLPYTPKLESLTLSYSSSTKIKTDQATSPTEKFYHIHPFENVELQFGENIPLLSPLSNGTFWLGIENLSPPQNLSILFQFLEGSANPDIHITRTDVKWSYWSKNRWVDFKGQEIQVDTTSGLQTSGVIEFSIPALATLKTDTFLGKDKLHWIRANLNRPPEGINRLLGVHSQAAIATFIPPVTNELSNGKILEAGKIKKLAIRNAAIKRIEQPYASFGGRPKETQQFFFQRISERLRHKQRAITVWDYEKIILEAFPSIYKVKCLNHANTNSEVQPGSINLIVIPNLLNQNAIDPLQPKTSTIIRERIKNHIQSYTSFFTSIQVENPRYEPIQVEFKVGLKPGFDGSFYGNLLNKEIKKFMSPWAFQEGKDIIFGGRIYKSSILQFLEERPYIDYITDLKLWHLNKAPGIGEMCVDVDFIIADEGPGEEVLAFAEASTARSILVSAPNHHITVLRAGERSCTSASIPTGIGTMVVDFNFIVS